MRNAPGSKNDCNENMSMDENEKLEVGSDERAFVEEDWNEAEQDEVPGWTEPDKPMTMETWRGEVGAKRQVSSITGMAMTS